MARRKARARLGGWQQVAALVVAALLIWLLAPVVVSEPSSWGPVAGEREDPSALQLRGAETGAARTATERESPESIVDPAAAQPDPQAGDEGPGGSVLSAVVAGDPSSQGAGKVEPEVTPAEEPVNFALVGRVEDGRSGEPFPGATVTVTCYLGEVEEGRRSAELTTSSDAEGGFRLEIQERVDWGRVVARAQGYVDSEVVRVECPREGERRVRDVLELFRGSGLTGVVVDEAGQPVAGAEVRSEGPREASDRSDASGAFELDQLPEGVYDVRAEAEGFLAGGAADVPLTDNRRGQARIVLRRAANLWGYLRGVDGRPLGRAPLFAFQEGERLAQAESDADGRFEFPALPAGQLEVLARSEDSTASVRQELSLVPAQPLQLDLQLQPSPRIQGRVVRPSGEGVAKLSVRAESLDTEAVREARTGPDGSYSVEGLYPGRYRLWVEPKNGRNEGSWVETVLTVPVNAGDLLQDLTLPDGALYAGRVVDGQGKPVRGANVFAIGEADYRGSARTNRQGQFRLADLEAGVYTIYVRLGQDRAVTRFPLELGAGQRVEGVQIVIESPARLLGRVLDQDERPLVGIEVFLEGVDDPVEREARSDAQGKFQIGPLYRGGRYRVVVDADGLTVEAHRRGSLRFEAPEPVITVPDTDDPEVTVTVRFLDEPEEEEDQGQ